MDKYSEKLSIRKHADVIVLCLCVAAALFIAYTFTGQWPWKGQPYNSYILQAQSWLAGRLDLGQDYPYLELAIFNGKYYVSFPPFPSYVMLPFVLLGWNTCDGMIELAFSLAGAVYAYKIMRHFNIKESTAAFFALFLTLGSNWFMTAQNAWVWFIAQNMAFTLCLMAIYYALKNKAGLSLAFWACAVGCRPFQALYIPVLLYLLYNAHKAENPDDRITDIIKKRWRAVIPTAVIALSYMILNFARFGNIAEFGHNYLPEFMRVKDGQFSLAYIPQNISSIFRLPQAVEGKWQYPSANGMCIFMISPIIVSFILYIVRSLVKKTKPDFKSVIMIAAICVAQIIAITAHKTLGGAHFGNRYINDILPFIFLGIGLMLPEDDDWVKMNYPLFIMGFTLNFFGTVMFYV